MREIPINSFAEYKERTESHKIREWIYRGHNNHNYKLESSLYRMFERNREIRYGKAKDKKTIALLRHEKVMLESFKRTSHMFFDSTLDKYSSLDLLALMQHYGAPTRMLDFSFSPYVALYFALSGAHKEDAVVYCINHKKMKDELNKSQNKSKSFKILCNEKDESRINLKCYESKFINERLFAQQGVFLVPNTLIFSHEEILDKCESTNFCLKLRIKTSCFSEIIKELYKMNITASTIFPGLEGFCKSFENIGVLSIKSFHPLDD